MSITKPQTEGVNIVGAIAAILASCEARGENSRDSTAHSQHLKSERFGRLGPRLYKGIVEILRRALECIRTESPHSGMLSASDHGAK